MICGWCGLPINPGDEHGIQQDRTLTDPAHIALNMVCRVKMLCDRPKFAVMWTGVTGPPLAKDTSSETELG